MRNDIVYLIGPGGAERIYDGCTGCGDRKIVFQRAYSKKFEEATVTETDLHSKTERQGKLSAYYDVSYVR